MATKTFYATSDFKYPGYPTRMLRAGQPVELSAPLARLYQALGKITPDKPRTAQAAAPAETPVPTPKPKAAPRKRRAKK